MSEPIVVEVGEKDLADLESMARKHCQRSFAPGERSHEQAMLIVASFVGSFADGAQWVKRNGQVLATGGLDGDAVRGAVQAAAKDLAPGVDDSRALRVVVKKRRRTMWQILTDCGPSVVRMLHWEPKRESYV